MLQRIAILLLISTQFISCKEDDENPLIKKIVGTYEGVVNYHDGIIPGDDPVEFVDIIVSRHSNGEVKITATFELVLPVTGSFETDRSDVISLGAGRSITYHSREVKIETGGTNFNGWGEMCGYVHVEDERLMITFGWSNETEAGGGFIYGTRKH